MTEIELIPGSEIPQDQVEEIRRIFVLEGLQLKVSSQVYLRKTEEELPPILVLIIAGLVGGVFGAMGKDIWEALKRGIGKAFSFLKENWGQNPQIQLQFKEEDSRIIVNFPTEDENLIQEAISKLPDYLDKRPKGSAWMWFDKDSHEWKAS